MKIDGVNLLPGGAEYPLDQWYVIAFSDEVTEKPIQREIDGVPVALYRTQSGEPVALFDRCPHRGMPLSQGTLVGENLQCLYHGLEFNKAGACALVPSGGAPPSKMAVRSYPLHEVWKWIWIWPGDPAKADPALIPDHEEIGLTKEGFYSYAGLHLPVDANYLLPFENLVDATHISFLHHGLIDIGNVATHPFEMSSEGPKVRMTRRFENDTVPPMLQNAFQLRSPHVNRTLELTGWAPNLCVVRTHFEEIDYPGEFKDNRIIVALTPASKTKTHQFAVIAQTYVREYMEGFEDLRHLLMEDVVAIEEIQRMFDRLPEDQLPEVSVRADEGGIRTRRIIAQQIRSEREGAVVRDLASA